MTTNINAALKLDLWDFADLSLKLRFAQALSEGATRYPIHRVLRFAARIELEQFFDALALRKEWNAQRLDSDAMILDSADVFISAHGGRKAEYCSCYFGIWAATIEAAEQAQALVLSVAGAARITEPMFSIDWQFLTGKGELKSASIEELANDVLHDEAYPEIKGGVNAFIDRYINADETVLVLQGPPGTGKTRLIRTILGRISRLRGHDAQALYTGDKKALENDEIFVKFITGSEDAFVVEDADHILKPRADGNEHLHRFLTIADGVVRSQGRKIIFSTNLPNVGDLDDALVRPGRCFARLYIRELSKAESMKLVTTLVANDTLARDVTKSLEAKGKNSYSLADIYSVIKNTRQASETIK
jgi:hypothetical protein